MAILTRAELAVRDNRGATMAAPNSDFTLIVVPTYNERENLPHLFNQIRQFAPDCHLLVVDDCSPDGTAEFAESLFEGIPGYGVLKRTGPRGLGLSYVDGYRQAL